MLLFYTSGHGLGHISRESVVMKSLKALRPELKLGVRTPAAEWFVKESIPPGTLYQPAQLDIGVLQIDSLQMEILGTLEKYAGLISRKADIIAAEAEWCLRHSVELIISDIPPFAFDIAQKVGVPSICIANFSWDWIYRPYVEMFPDYEYVIEDIAASHSKCGLCLQTPFSGDLSSFPRRRAIPLIGRSSHLSKEEARARAGFSPDMKVILFSFGGFGLKNPEELKVDLKDDTLIVVTQPDAQAEGWLRFTKNEMKAKDLSYPDLVRAADAVITKPGYGIVSECIANETKMLYVERELFPEYEIFAAEMGKYLPAQHLPSEDFFTGRWKRYMDMLWNKPEPAEKMPVDGAEEAAEIILGML